ncbi:MAG: sugar ABC transporter substrate-binding protein, partial [Microbacterium sp.]
KDVLTAWNAMNASDGLVGYLDSATPSMGDAMFPALQSLLGGQATPEDTAAVIQKNWDKYYGAK